jgi:DNA invertase Pin-like site-specific DNA recombinase
VSIINIKERVNKIVNKIKYNHFDRKSKGKLTEDQVKEIRKLLSQGKTQVKIAEKFNISPAQVSSIKARRIYDWVK